MDSDFSVAMLVLQGLNGKKKQREAPEDLS